MVTELGILVPKVARVERVNHVLHSKRAYRRAEDRVLWSREHTVDQLVFAETVRAFNHATSRLKLVEVERPFFAMKTGESGLED